MKQYHRKVNGEPTRLLVRHADAGDRGTWIGPDELRPLSDVGVAQARALADRIDGMPIVRVLSSPSLRCLQTVAPLANRLSLDVELSSLLRVDADPGCLAAFLRDPLSDNAVLCTHRETLTALFELLAPGAVGCGDAAMPMAAAWMVVGGPDRPCRVKALRPVTDVDPHPNAMSHHRVG